MRHLFLPGRPGIPTALLLAVALCLASPASAAPFDNGAFIARVAVLFGTMAGIGFVFYIFYRIAATRLERIVLLMLLVIGVPVSTLALLNKIYREEAAQQAAPSQVLTGPARVIDAGVVEIAGEPLRLYGIHAPGPWRSCVNTDGLRWDCGMVAAQALADRIGDQPVSCDGQHLDQDGHLHVVCHVDGTGLNNWLVRMGHAWALDGSDYVAAEAEARKARRGIWQIPFAAEHGRPRR